MAQTQELNTPLVSATPLMGDERLQALDNLGRNPVYRDLKQKMLERAAASGGKLEFAQYVFRDKKDPSLRTDDGAAATCLIQLQLKTANYEAEKMKVDQTLKTMPTHKWGTLAMPGMGNEAIDKADAVVKNALVFSVVNFHDFGQMDFRPGEGRVNTNYRPYTATHSGEFFPYNYQEPSGSKIVAEVMSRMPTEAGTPPAAPAPAAKIGFLSKMGFGSKN